MENRELTGEIMMESSRLSDDSSQSDTEQRPTFGETASIFDDSSNQNFSNKRRRCDFDNDNNVEDEVNLELPINNTSDIGKRLMEKMGYSEGTGLGKYGQGRLQPVAAYNQKGRRGLGHDSLKLEDATSKWDPALEVVKIQEDMIWLSTDQYAPLKDELSDWMVLGPSKNTIDDETLFCDAHIVEEVIQSKSVFDDLHKYEMHRARTRSNPFETIRGVFFQNRAAVKMANLDKACDFLFTNPSSLESHELLYFADVCAGPGGFSEYVLWRKKWNAKGYGFTLKDSNDFDLDRFCAGPPETFHPFYGPKEDGNVYDPENQNAFQRLILNQTRNKGVHFMMADGGFSVEGQHNIQEILSKQLYLCQCLVALMIVREGGHFVTKLFDLFTPFSAGLVYLMYRCFKRVCIFKPNTSRPANSERYLICEHKLPNVDDVIHYLQRANNIILKGDKNRDVMELVPFETLRGDDNFFQYLKESNELLGRKQVVSLSKLAAYSQDSELSENRQSEIRRDCLEYWELPDETRPTTLSIPTPKERLQFICEPAMKKFIKGPPKSNELTLENMDFILNPPCDWYCAPSVYSGSSGKLQGEPTFYFGMGHTLVFRLVKNKWEPVDRIELPSDTLVYAEMVTEYRGQYKTQRKTKALHIIDGIYLGAEDISHKYLPERQALINKFCEALWKPENNVTDRVRSKELFSLDEDLTEKLKLESKLMKNSKKIWAYHPPEDSYSRNSDKDEESYFIIPRSLIFLKCTMLPWSLYLSRSTGFHYFFNHRTNERVYNDRRPDSAIATFADTFEKRYFWNWSDDQEISIQSLNEKIKTKCPNLRTH